MIAVNQGGKKGEREWGEATLNQGDSFHFLTLVTYEWQAVNFDGWQS